MHICKNMHVWVPCGFMWPPTCHNQREGMREVSEYEQLFLTQPRKCELNHSDRVCQTWIKRSNQAHWMTLQSMEDFFFFFFCLQTSPAQGPPSTYPFVFLQFTGITAPKCWSDFSETWARHHLIGLFPKFAQWHSHIDRVAGTFQFSKEALLLLVLLNLSMDFNGSHYFVQYNQPKLITLFLYFTCYNNMWIVIDHEADDLKRDCQCDWAFYFTALCTRKNCITGCTLFCSIISFGGGGILIFLNLF